MVGRIDRLKSMKIIATKCVAQYRMKNKGRCLVVLSREDEIHDNTRTEAELGDYYMR